MRVQKAYAFQGDCSERVLLASDGRMFRGTDWEFPTEDIRLVPLAGTIERWVDVPAAWLGFAPWWR
jgi:hypothetical protein